MRPDTSPNACWTSFIGAPMHDLGTLPEKCFTCAAKQREVVAQEQPDALHECYYCVGQSAAVRRTCEHA